MKVLLIKIYTLNDGVEFQEFMVENADYEKDDMKNIYFKYVKPWLDTFPHGTIVDWEWRWGLGLRTFPQPIARSGS